MEFQVHRFLGKHPVLAPGWSAVVALGALPRDEFETDLLSQTADLADTFEQSVVRFARYFEGELSRIGILIRLRSNIFISTTFEELTCLDCLTILPGKAL